MTRPASDCLFMIAARKPVPGLTKTRLGALIGMEQAATLYRAFLHDLAGRFMGNDREYDLAWAHTPESAPFDEVLRELLPERDAGSARYISQVGDDWAERQAGLMRCGAELGYARVVLTASDSPHLSRGMVGAAFDALREADVVIGRVHDGGYYLIGMRGYHDILSGVPMSTMDAADMVVASARARGLRVAEVEPTFDIDVEADLALLRDLLRQDPAAAPQTARVLGEIIGNG